MKLEKIISHTLSKMCDIMSKNNENQSPAFKTTKKYLININENE